MSSELRKRVKIELIKRGMTTIDLANIVNERLGYRIDNSYITKVLDGKIKKSKVTEVVCKELGIKPDKAGGGKSVGRV